MTFHLSSELMFCFTLLRMMNQKQNIRSLLKSKNIQLTAVNFEKTDLYEPHGLAMDWWIS